MEAKGTILNDATKRQFRYIPDKPSQDISRWDIEGLLALQAEITFDAGRKAGIREVVEWINSHSEEAHDCYYIDSEEWHNKLKKWGLGDEEMKVSEEE